MTHPTSITRQAIRTPRAAAVAGIAFSSLLSAAMVSSASHYRVIRTTLRTGSPMAPSKPLHSSPSTCSHSPASHFSLVHRGGTGPDRRRRGPVLRDGVLGQWAALRRHAVRHRGGGRRPRAVRGEPSGPGVWSFGRRVSSTLLTVYAMRMAAVFAISTTTIATRLRLAPRWLTILGLASGVILLLSAGFIPWIEVVFPVWVFVFSLHILVASFRNGEPTTGNEPAA